MGEVSGAAQEGRHHHPSSSRCIQVGHGKGAAGDNEEAVPGRANPGGELGGMWLHGGNKRGSLRARGYERELW